MQSRIIKSAQRPIAILSATVKRDEVHDFVHKSQPTESNHLKNNLAEKPQHTAPSARRSNAKRN